MNASPDLIEFLKGWEGPPHFDPREDPCSPGTWDIGYGHVCSQSAPSLTPEGALIILATDVRMVAAHVGSLLGDTVLEQNEFDALVSFAFNLGVAALASSTLLKLIQAGDASAPDQFGRWVRSGGNVVAGLAKRRAAERAMYVSADYSQRP